MPGSPGHKQALLFSAFDKKTYRLIGRIWSYSICHRGPFPRCLTPAMMDRIIGTCASDAFDDINLVVENDYRNNIKAVCLFTLIKSTITIFSLIEPLY